MRARDQSAQISGYLYYRNDKSRHWKRKWFVVYDVVMYQFKKHEVIRKRREGEREEKRERGRERELFNIVFLGCDGSEKYSPARLYC